MAQVDSSEAQHQVHDQTQAQTQATAQGQTQTQNQNQTPAQATAAQTAPQAPSLRGELKKIADVNKVGKTEGRKTDTKFRYGRD
ncbi:Anaphase-promoting complex subunit [Venturia inaequalis]|nr:Anaphase-promoting complex subunit [Venturia inaequalis]